MTCIHQGKRIGSILLDGTIEPAYQCLKGHLAAHRVSCVACPSFQQDSPLRELIAPPEKTYDRPDSIRVAVYTCPRKRETLRECLDSLLKAGFPKENITIFYDGMEPTERDFSYVASSFKKFAFPSYATSIFTMLMTSGRTYETLPGRHAYLLCQDDVQFTPRPVYDYLLNEVLYPCPEKDFGFMSLYCAAWYAAKNQENAKAYPWVQEPPRFVDYQGKWVWSGQAILFSQESARSFIQATAPWSALGWYYDSNKGEVGATGLHKIDYVTGQWARTVKRKIYQASASFCEHVGRYSTIFSEKQTCYGTRGAYRVL